MAAALASGRVDVAMIPEPALTIAKHTTARLFGQTVRRDRPGVLDRGLVLDARLGLGARVQRKRFADVIYEARAGPTPITTRLP